MALLLTLENPFAKNQLQGEVLMTKKEYLWFMILMILYMIYTAHWIIEMDLWFDLGLSMFAEKPLWSATTCWWASGARMHQRSDEKGARFHKSCNSREMKRMRQRMRLLIFNLQLLKKVAYILNKRSKKVCQYLVPKQHIHLGPICQHATFKCHGVLSRLAQPVSRFQALWCACQKSHLWPSKKNNERQPFHCYAKP